MTENLARKIRRPQRIIIFGAGELGQLLVERLAPHGHIITVIDFSDSNFSDIREKSDVNTICSELSVSTLRQANAHLADMLIAVSGDEHANIVACQLANFLGVKHTICRLYSDFFETEAGSQEETEKGNIITPEYFGIGKAFSSPKECAWKIVNVVCRPIVLDEVRFYSGEAVMATGVILPVSPLCDRKMRDLASLLPGYETRNGLGCGSILEHIRIAAIVRNGKLFFPKGETILEKGDRLYVCGLKEYTDHFLLYAQGNDNPSRPHVVICGTGIIPKIIVKELLRRDAQVHVIAPDRIRAEEFMREIPAGAILHAGSTHDEEVLREAGVEYCDAFVAAGENEAENLMGAILARRIGAAKVVSVTYKPEYIGIVPELTAVDCAFNATQINANMVLHCMDCGLERIDSRLQMFDAFLGEFEIGPKSPLAGKALKECKLPENMVLAMLFHENKVISPNGNTILQPGDVVAAIVRHSSEENIRRQLG